MSTKDADRKDVTQPTEWSEDLESNRSRESGPDTLPQLPESDALKRQTDRNVDSGLLELVNDLVMSLSIDGSKLLYINSAAETIYGRSLAEIYDDSTHWIDAVHPEDQVALRQGLVHIVTKDVFEHQFRVLKPNGEESWLVGTFNVIRDPNGEPISIGGIAKDISKRVVTEQRL